jgi:hypothetical protein
VRAPYLKKSMLKIGLMEPAYHERIIDEYFLVQKAFEILKKRGEIRRRNIIPNNYCLDKIIKHCKIPFDYEFVSKCKKTRTSLNKIWGKICEHLSWENDDEKNDS